MVQEADGYEQVDTFTGVERAAASSPPQGYKLSVAQDGSDPWTFPAGVSLAPGQYMVIFADGKDRTNPSKPLHTNFDLSVDDGYVGLLMPDGSVSCGVHYPKQV
jgi:hypothetical protein